MAWISINFESKALGMPVMTNVLMPQGRGGYKTLYLLHGAGGDYASWLLKSRVADYAEGKNIAVVILAVNLADSLALADRLIRIRNGQIQEIYDQKDFSRLPDVQGDSFRQPEKW